MLETCQHEPRQSCRSLGVGCLRQRTMEDAVSNLPGRQLAIRASCQYLLNSLFQETMRRGWLALPRNCSGHHPPSSAVSRA